MKKAIIRSMSLLILTILLASTGFAANGEPLRLESSTPENGAVDVAIDIEEIELFFSKNVVNMSVADNNRTCIDFVDGDGNPLAFELRMEDDQVDREFRDYVYVQPVEKLTEGMTYTIIISKDMTSKSGTAMEEDVEISFTTVGGAPAAEGSDQAADARSNMLPVWIGVIAAIVIGSVLYSRSKKS